jgi:hypothetical protein
VTVSWPETGNWPLTLSRIRGHTARRQRFQQRSRSRLARPPPPPAGLVCALCALAAWEVLEQPPPPAALVCALRALAASEALERSDGQRLIRSGLAAARTWALAGPSCRSCATSRPREANRPREADRQYLAARRPPVNSGHSAVRWCVVRQALAARRWWVVRPGRAGRRGRVEWLRPTCESAARVASAGRSGRLLHRPSPESERPRGDWLVPPWRH